MNSDERAEYIEEDDELENIHEEAATMGQSDQLEVDEVENHFIAFK